MSVPSNEARPALQTSVRRKSIPGPKSLNPFSSMLAFQRTPLQFLTALMQDYGDIAQFSLLTMPIVVISHPDYVKRVMQDKNTVYDKDVLLFKVLGKLMGNGLVTIADHQAWLPERRRMQPAFHRQRIAAMGATMTSAAVQMLDHWETYAKQKQVFDAAEEIARLTLKIAGLTLFSIDISEKTSNFGQAFEALNRALTEYMRFPYIPLSVPTPSHRSYYTSLRMMDEVAYTIIQHRRQNPEDKGDLLSILMESVDEETGQGMSDKQLRDEIMTLLVAGYETSAAALAWIWTQLALHPEVELHVHEELDRVLGGRLPTIEDLPRLPYSRMVIEETMRLYPSGWQVMRRAVEDDEIAGYPIPANTTLFWSQYLVHRHPDFWENPEVFDPERFTPEHVAQRPHHAYVPFGLGPRMCIGNTFALTEMQLILATIAQRYRLVLEPGHKVEPLAFLSLRPNGVPVRLQARVSS